jgi:hypothetical protein
LHHWRWRWRWRWRLLLLLFLLLLHLHLLLLHGRALSLRLQLRQLLLCAVDLVLLGLALGGAALQQLLRLGLQLRHLGRQPLQPRRHALPLLRVKGRRLRPLGKTEIQWRFAESRDLTMKYSSSPAPASSTTTVSSSPHGALRFTPARPRGIACGRVT